MVTHRRLTPPRALSPARTARRRRGRSFLEVRAARFERRVHGQAAAFEALTGWGHPLKHERRHGELVTLPFSRRMASKESTSTTTASHHQPSLPHRKNDNPRYTPTDLLTPATHVLLHYSSVLLVSHPPARQRAVGQERTRRRWQLSSAPTFCPATPRLQSPPGTDETLPVRCFCSLAGLRAPSGALLLDLRLSSSATPRTSVELNVTSPTARPFGGRADARRVSSSCCFPTPGCGGQDDQPA